MRRVQKVEAWHSELRKPWSAPVDDNHGPGLCMAHRVTGFAKLAVTHDESEALVCRTKSIAMPTVPLF
jgi:hypothetical protein